MKKIADLLGLLVCLFLVQLTVVGVLGDVGFVPFRVSVVLFILALTVLIDGTRC